MNPGGGGCGEPRLCLCTPAWATRVKLRLKKKKYAGEEILNFKDEDKRVRLQEMSREHVEKEEFPKVIFWGKEFIALT